MSGVDATAYVMRLALKTPAHKLALLAVAARCDQNYSCYPSRALVAGEALVSEERAKTLLRELRRDGYLSARARYRENGSKTSNRYFVHGPWDRWNDTNVPFPEITYYADKDDRYAAIREGEFIPRPASKSGQKAEERGGVVSNPSVTSHLEPVSANRPRPSVRDVQVPNASGSGTDGRTDGGGVIEVQEQGPVPAGEGPAADAALPETDAAGAGGAAVGGVAPVEMTPGVEVLRAIATEAPEWTIRHAESLRDQGLTVTGMLAAGFTPQEIRHALVSTPPPDKVTHTVGAVVGRRLRDLLAAGPVSAVRPIPAQTSGHPQQPTERRADLSSAASVSWAERQQQLAAATSGHGPQRDCQGETCTRLALPGEDLCARCLRGVDPVCAAGCGRTVVTEGSMCIPCVDAADTAGALGCPGHDGPCGRTVQTVTGLCWKCEAARTQARQESPAPF
ncbi:hypothetical protein ACFWOJ_37170 [Streptomyces sp. NPDC058439]|uniref:hypothetical protein n=1 Tax=Streptomyces sp. NPDC058439 TaxID=3346500 RepID=UPI00364BC5C8